MLLEKTVKEDVPKPHTIYRKYEKSTCGTENLDEKRFNATGFVPFQYEH